MKRARLKPSYAGLLRHVGKCSVAVIAVQNIFTVLGDKQVWKSVVIEIAPNATQPISCSQHTGFIGDICERAVVIVPIESIYCCDPAAIKVSPIHKIDVLPAIAIEIRDAN